MKSLFSIFQKGLQKTATSITRTFADVFTGAKKWDIHTYEELEAALIAADFGIEESVRIVADIKDRYECGQIKMTEDIFQIVRRDVCEILKKNMRPVKFAVPGKLTVIMLVGVNGSGKTTTAGKLAYYWSNEGRKVMLAACDTFRAAAVEQLKLWGGRTGAQVVSARQGADPSSVAFDAVEAALARKMDILIIDTAGRQHTRKSLMDELAKMRRTVVKVYPDAPHEVWITIDGSMGSNSLNQASEFSSVAGVSGLVLTKLDGTGRGGIAVAIQDKLKLPVFFVGLGEQPDDLQPFDPEYYSDAVLGKQNLENSVTETV
ncbi:MAG: signal recognition particle-docking protein FtsY [Lentisphaerae bacterium GWF2_44_16]|nr:MAG: signal recognition particle-docking protein FtsY [Lentisphaerae bacterium GWF2_44_16]